MESCNRVVLAVPRVHCKIGTYELAKFRKRRWPSYEAGLHAANVAGGMSQMAKSCSVEYRAATVATLWQKQRLATFGMYSSELLVADHG